MADDVDSRADIQYKEMSDRVQSLEQAVLELSPVELQEFSSWFIEYDQAVWDKQIEEDAKSGKLDFLRQEAKAEREAGHLKEL